MSAGEHTGALGSEDAAEEAILPAVSCNRHVGLTLAREMTMAHERM